MHPATVDDAIAAVSTMASLQEEAQYVIWLAESKSIVMARHISAVRMEETLLSAKRLEADLTS
jgi:hypothetical protein